jgi:endonuclease/exonuclease/phosphatase family metal-dependent hydrolase
MRLATWNCQSGLESNWDVIEELDADVLAMQEARSGTPDLVAQHEGWTCIWREGKYYPGLAVLVRLPFQIERPELSEPFAISALVTGPERFRFVDFWAMTPGNVGGLSYTQQARRIIDQLPEDGVPTVVAGDFNHSKHPPHLENVRKLNGRGLVSAYHSHHSSDHLDEEREMTRYGGGPYGRAWHIDLVFVPDYWTITSVEVGRYDRSPGGARSDHVPVVVTIGATQTA